jgi:hypothetical protein
MEKIQNLKDMDGWKVHVLQNQISKVIINL